MIRQLLSEIKDRLAQLEAEIKYIESERDLANKTEDRAAKGELS